VPTAISKKSPPERSGELPRELQVDAHSASSHLVTISGYIISVFLTCEKCKGINLRMYKMCKGVHITIESSIFSVKMGSAVCQIQSGNLAPSAFPPSGLSSNCRRL